MRRARGRPRPRLAEIGPRDALQTDELFGSRQYYEVWTSLARERSEAHRNYLALAQDIGEKLLEGGNPKMAIRNAFDIGFGCAWNLQQKEREWMSEKLKDPALAGSDLVAYVRNRLAKWQTPEDRFLAQMDNAAKAARAARTRGETLRRDAETRRASWLPIAQKEYSLLRGKHPTWGKQYTAKSVAKQCGVSYKSILRNLAQVTPK